MIRDFTGKIYENLCTLIEKLYTPMTVQQYLQQGNAQATRPLAVIRHDVDRWPNRALRMARIEARFSIASTYYFRVVPFVFLPEIIREIAGLGHEIGYHYEVVSKARGNYEKAAELFARELERMRSIVPVHTVAMHGRPLSPFDNRTLWEHRTLAEFGLDGECYLSIDYDRILYLSDTGRNWQPGKNNIRDLVASRLDRPCLETTGELIEFLKENRHDVCLLIHPNRWTDRLLPWLGEYLFDMGANLVKKGIGRMRKSSSLT